ncbi:hypothetical protein [Marilutibacter alkalisoli]|uniref:Cysteine dioxygenase n=1 Tax=Marilutibacter alkalisoli TaxID=2591633 RepID=A0A514BU88_9GAMM|nr:hypothetical protein [Lysobacter alkalisoli]QDH70875.1 hypothetical protein FKV23_12860 [Lysobacter alkalisoli]
MITEAITAVIRWARRRGPDFVVGGAEDPYLLRWYLIPRNPLFNIYLHCFLRDDDDRALHDHPWFWCSVLLRGTYVEHTIAAGGIHSRRKRRAPSIKVSSPWRAHRIELERAPAYRMAVGSVGPSLPAWTLFITGPRIRSWGFHCPEQGWVHWRKFTDPNDTGRTGPGCGDATGAQAGGA